MSSGLLTTINKRGARLLERVSGSVRWNGQQSAVCRSIRFLYGAYNYGRDSRRQPARVIQQMSHSHTQVREWHHVHTFDYILTCRNKYALLILQRSNNNLNHYNGCTKWLAAKNFIAPPHCEISCNKIYCNQHNNYMGGEWGWYSQ